MFNPQLVSDPDGAPALVVTLDAVDVQRIAMHMRQMAEEHREQITQAIEEGDENAALKIERQSEMAATAAQWDLIDQQMTPLFWNWTEGTPADLPLHPDYAESLDNVVSITGEV